jgi:drug/metabolite transporter (DMT)-like permease
MYNWAMLYLMTIVTAFLLSVGQALWKSAALGFSALQKENTLIGAILKVMFSVKFIAGALVYLIATLIYLWLFSKYPFSAVQITLISASLVLSVVISRFIFKETLNPINYLGIVIILLGVFLATKR